MRAETKGRSGRTRRSPAATMAGIGTCLLLLGLVTPGGGSDSTRPELRLVGQDSRGSLPSQDVVTLSAQLDAASRPTVLLSAPARVGDQAITEARLSVAGLVDPRVGHLPEGWVSSTDGSLLALSGPALAADRLAVRIDLGAEATLSSLPVELAGGGATLYQRATSLNTIAPLQVLETLESALHFPWRVVPGEVVEFEAAATAGITSGGTWAIAGSEPTALPAVSDQLRYRWEVPTALRSGASFSVTWTNPFGQTVVNVSSAPVVVISPPTSAAQASPRLDDCTPRGFAGRVVCLCGWFPTAESRSGFTIGGLPLRVVGSSIGSVLVEIPSSAPVGPQSIEASRAAGFSAATTEIVVLAASGSVDQDRLLRGETTPLRLEVQGTSEPLDIVLTNYTPGVVAVTGGMVQVVRTSGGTPNVAERMVQGISPGAFDVGYQLAEDPCPCARGGTVVADNPLPDSLPPVPPGQGGTRTPGQGPPTGSTGRPPLPPVPPALPPLPPVPPVTPPSAPPPEEEEEEEEEACCGFREDGTLTFPKITDPLVPASEGVAPRAPAVGGAQVLLHSGAYFHNQTDLDVDAVGLPFRFSRHYKGDVETVEGGVLGHRWDFSLNKRIVPAAVRELGSNLLLERPGLETPQLWYFDGQGRGGHYEGAQSEWRDVLNFGQPTPFRAWVTSYRQQPGDFFEIQRYVLEDPERHPFAGHPDVDVEQDEAIFYVLRERNGVRYIFNCRGQLLHILHRNDLASLAGSGVAQPSDSVRITLEYQGALNPLTQNRMLSLARDPSGHLYQFGTEPLGRASLDTNIDGVPRSEMIPIPRFREVRGGGRAISFVYDTGSDGAPLLASVTDSVGGDRRTWRYAYDDEDRLESVTSPEQVASLRIPHITNRYDGSGRVIEQVLGDPDATSPQRTRFSYQAGTTLLTDAHDHKVQYDLERVGGFPVVVARTVIQSDSAGQGSWTTRYEYNGQTQVTRIVHPRGNEVLFEFDGRDDPVTEGWIRNANAGTTYASDLSAGNLVAVTRAPGATGAGPSVTTLMSWEPLFNQIEAQEDGRGYRTEYTYAYMKPGDLGNALAVKPPDLTRPDGSGVPVPATEYDFNLRGQPVRSHLGGRRETVWTYNRAGYLVEERFPTAARRIYSRDPFGRLVAESGDFGDARYDLGPFGEVERMIQDPSGFANVTETLYDRDGLPVEVRRELKDNFAAASGAPPPEATRWVTTRMEYDLLGRVLREVRNPGSFELAVENAYDATGRLSRSSRPGPDDTRVVDRYHYDARGLATVAWSAEGTPQEVVVRTVFDENGNETREERVASRAPPGTTAGAPRIHGYAYDGLDRLVARTDPLGTRTELELDPDGHIFSETSTDASGSVLSRIERSVDELGHEIQVVHHALDGSGQRAVEQVWLNGFLENEWTVGPAGGVTRYVHDDGGRILEVVTPGGDTTRTRYDRAGNQTEVFQIEVGEAMQGDASRVPVRSATRHTYEYDALGRVREERADAHEVRYFHDSFGNARGTRLGDGTADSIRYDAMGRKLEHHAGVLTRRYQYGRNGLPAEVTDGRTTTRFAYDAMGQVREEERTGSGVTRYDYDGLGNPLRVTDANGTVVTSTFNGVGLPLTQTIRTSTVAGALPSVIAPDEIRWTYDGLGRVLVAEVDHPASSAPIRTRFTWDGLSRTTSEEQGIDGERYLFTHAYGRDHLSSTTTYPAQAGGLTVEREADALGRLQFVVADGRVVASYAFDGPSRVSGRSYANGVVTRYDLDDQRRLNRIDVTATTGFATPKRLWSDAALYGRFGLERIEQTWHPDVTGAWSESLTEMTFDPEGRVVRSSTVSSEYDASSLVARSRSSFLSEFGGGALTRTAETLYDEVTQRTRYVRSDQFSQDSIGRNRRIDVAIATEVTDPALMLTTVPEVEQETRVADDRLAASKEFVHDRSGQLISDGELRYAYDHEGRLALVEELGVGGQRGEAVHFIHDAFGRRVRSLPLAPPQATGLVSWGSWAREPVHFLFDGDGVVAEIAPPGVGAAPPTLRRRYVLGARPGERVRMEHWGGPGAPDVYYPHEGIQADVAFVTNALGRTARLGFTTPPSGVGFTVPDDVRTVEGTSVRVPYVGWSTRVDGFAGTRTDELTGTPHLDYRSIRSLADSAAMRSMSRAVSTSMNDGALVLGAASTALVGGMVGGALLAGGTTHLTWSGLGTWVGVSSGLSSGVGATIAWYTEDPSYGPKAFLRDAGTGALFGLIGGQMSAAGWRLSTAFAGEQLLQNVANTANGVIHGRGIGEAWSDALLDNAVGTVMGAGLVSLGAGRAALGAWLRRRAARVEAGGVHMASSRATASGSFQQGYFKDVVGTRGFTDLKVGLAGIDDLGRVIMASLDGGTPVARATARALRDGTLTVRLANFNDPLTRGLILPNKPNFLYINSEFLYGAGSKGPFHVASTIVHEAVHGFGGGEIAAHVAQAQFLVHVLKRTGAIRGNRLRLSRARWLEDHDIGMVQAWWRGRRSGKFDDLATFMVTAGGYGKGRSPIQYLGRPAGNHLQAGGGFARLLGVDAQWAALRARDLDARGRVGHWE